MFGVFKLVIFHNIVIEDMTHGSQAVVSSSKCGEHLQGGVAVLSRTWQGQEVTDKCPQLFYAILGKKVKTITLAIRSD